MKGLSVTSFRRCFCTLFVVFLAVKGFAKNDEEFPEHYRFYFEKNWGALQESVQTCSQQRYSCHSEGWLNAMELFILMDDKNSFLQLLHGCSAQRKEQSSFQRGSSAHLSYDSLLTDAQKVFGIGERTEELVWNSVRSELQYSILKVLNRRADLRSVPLNADRSFQWFWVLAFLTPTLIIVLLFAKEMKPVESESKGFNRSGLPERLNFLLNAIESQINSENFSPHFEIQLSQLEFEFKPSSNFSDDDDYASLTDQQRLILHFASRDFELNQVADYLSISKGHLYNERSAIRRKLNLNARAPMNSEARRWLTSKSVG